MISLFKNQWTEQLKEEINSDYFANLLNTLCHEYHTYTIFPPKDEIFKALKMVDYPKVKVCILGQDPYHGKGQANGMAFAVNDGQPFPPSLVNIFKELSNDLKVPMPNSGTLLGWAKQGVLLLNTTLTVREGQPLSHAGLNWERFTDAVILALSKREKPLVFILWGANAQAKMRLIGPRHYIIATAHPSPLSAHRGFFGSRPFSKANEFLARTGQTQIDWTDVSGNEASYYKTADKIKKV